MILADAAMVTDNKLSVLGGGWDFTVPGVPSAIGIIIQVPWDQANRPHTLDVLLEDADGVPVTGQSPQGEPAAVKLSLPFEVGRPPGVREGVPLSVAMAMNIGPMPLQPAKRYIWRLLIDNIGNDGWVRPFSVRPHPMANVA